jgi:hypothetical protein
MNNQGGLRVNFRISEGLFSKTNPQKGFGAPGTVKFRADLVTWVPGRIGGDCGGNLFISPSIPSNPPVIPLSPNQPLRGAIQIKSRVHQMEYSTDPWIRIQRHGCLCTQIYSQPMDLRSTVRI